MFRLNPVIYPRDGVQENWAEILSEILNVDIATLESVLPKTEVHPSGKPYLVGCYSRCVKCAITEINACQTVAKLQTLNGGCL